jgi:WD40 repeat protein
VLQPNVPRDLESICLKCLHKVQELRYTSAGAFAEDLRRFQMGEPVQANPVSRLEKALRWGRRHLPTATLLLGVLLALALVFAVLSARATMAQQEALQYKAVAEDAAQKNADAQQQKAAALTQRMEVEQKAAKLQARLGAVQLARVALLWHSDPWQARSLLHDVSVFPVQDRDAAWHFYHNLSTRAAALASLTGWTGPREGQRQTLRGHSQTVLALAASADGKTLASGDADGAIKLWDLAVGRERATVVKQRGPARSLGFWGNARILVSCGGGPAAYCWHEQTGDPFDALGARRRGSIALVLAASGSSLAVGHQDGSVTVWEAGNDQRLKVLARHTGPVTALVASADGKTLASAGADGTIMVWDDENSAESPSGLRPVGRVLALAFSPDGKILASAGEGKTIQLWRGDNYQQFTKFGEHAGNIQALAFSADGKTLASGSADGMVKLWDVSNSLERATIKGHPGGVSAVLWSADGRTLISAGRDGTIKLWDVGSR